MIATAKSNIDEVIRWYEMRLPKKAVHVLEILNEAEYAQYLQDRMGYWVLNDYIAQRIVWSELSQAAERASAAGEILTDQMIVDALETAADKIVDYYQQVVGYKPDRGKAMLPPRPQHPGSWADDTVTLVRSYVSYVDDEPEKRHPYQGGT